MRPENRALILNSPDAPAPSPLASVKQPAKQPVKQSIKHIAIIMDGNGRWAAARGVPRVMGHKAGVEAVRRTLKAVAEAGIPYLTLYGFSSENWKRPQQEVFGLMELLRVFLHQELEQIHAAGIRLRFIGDRSRFDVDIIAMLANAERYTEANHTLHVTVALSYGGRHELVRAAQALARKVAGGQTSIAAIDEAAFDAELYTATLPDPDIVIRTSGEQRISNFLLWQSAYAEFVFLDTLWPDFSVNDLTQALDTYNKRERRYGARLV